MASPAQTPAIVARRLTGLCGAAALVAALAACAPISFAQQAWEGRLDSADGVVDASWSFYNGWPTSSSKYTAEIETTPDLTEQQAREIARLSCEGSPRLDQLDARTTAQDGRWNATKYDLPGSCFNAEELVRYASVLAALEATGPDLRGQVDGLTFDPERPRRSGIDENTLDLQARTASVDTLFTLLREIRSRNTDVALGVFGAVSDDASQISSSKSPIDMLVPAGFDLDSVIPVLTSAYALDHHGIAFNADGITVSPETVAMISAPATLAVQAEAERAGIRFTVLPPGGGDADDQTGAAYSALTTALAALPGISSVELGGSETSVRASDEQAIAAALELIASSDDANAEFYIEGPADSMFVRVLRGAQQKPGTLEAFQQMLEARQTNAHSDYVALIVGSDSIRMRFDLDDTATKADISSARSALLQVIEQSPIDEVSLQPPYPAPWEELKATP